MRRRFSTIVRHSLLIAIILGKISVCANVKPINPGEEPKFIEQATAPEEPASLEHMSLPKPQMSPEEIRERQSRGLGPGYYYSFREHFLAALGYGGFLQGSASISGHLGYARAVSQSSFLQAAVEVYQQGPANGGFDLRYQKNLGSGRTRTFWTLGGAIMYTASDQLLNFIKLESYRLRGSLGVDHTWGKVFALRAELRLGFGMGAGLEDRLILGLVWPM